MNTIQREQEEGLLQNISKANTEQERNNYQNQLMALRGSAEPEKPDETRTPAAAPAS